MRQTAFFLGELGKVSQSIRYGGCWWQKHGHGHPERRGCWGEALMTGAALWGLQSARPPRGRHIRRPFRQLWAHHRHPTLEMRLWKNIFSRQSSVGTYSF